MDADVYAPPKAELDVDTDRVDEFYVVSRTKFLILFLSTFGLYSFYWFYRNWSLQKKAHGLSVWPLPRAIFQIFFFHSLFRAVEASLLRHRVQHAWRPSSLATSLVVVTLLSKSMDRMADKEIWGPWSSVLVFLLLFVLAWLFLQAQAAINAACLDPEGQRNQAFSAINLVWIVLGGLIWLLAIFGMLGPLFVPEWFG